LARHKYSRRRNQGFEAWGLENVIKAFFKCFVFSFFRLARYNLRPDFEKYSVGKMIIDYLIVCFITGVFATLNLWKGVVVIACVVLIPLILGIVCRIILKYHNRVKEPVEPEEIVGKHIEESKKKEPIIEENIKQNNYKYDETSANLDEMFKHNPVEDTEEKEVEYMPNFNAMSDLEIQKLVVETANLTPRKAHLPKNIPLKVVEEI
jgi:hypothetical protein